MIERTEEEIMKDWGVDNSDSPLVSVWCITYNHENYISQALDGFLMQKTNFPFEVIVHDDVSTDRTAEIIRGYERKFPGIIKPIYEEENQYSKQDGSLSRIMSAACRGKYIALCEGDDYWIDENKLQMQVDFLEANPEYGMCFHGAIEHYEDSSQSDKVFSNLQTREYTCKEIVSHWIIPTASIMFSANYLADGLYQQVLRDSRVFYGDKPLYILLSTRTKIWGMSNTMSVYRRHEGGAVFHFSFDRNYRNYFQTEAFAEYFPKAKRVLFLLKIRLAAYSCSIAICKNEWGIASRFFKLNVISNLFLVPAYLAKNLFRKSEILKL